MVWIWLPFAAYLIGSVPVGRIIGDIVAKVDVRAIGSGNIGATNVAREVGIGWGVLTLALDALKGAVAVTLAAAAGNYWGLPESCGLAAVLGHQFSMFSWFRGGKGVATALGVFVALDPLACAAATVLFFGVVVVTDMISVGSIAASSSMPVLIFLFNGSIERVFAALCIGVLIALAHRENIRRVIRGEERRWKRGVKTQPRRSRRPSSSSSE